MSTSRPYHHGDLHAVLLTAAEREADGGRLHVLSLRELARVAGVSPAAPYKHFPSKEALLAELATTWFEAFVNEQVAAADLEDAGQALRSTGLAYVAWATRYPHRFAFVFDTTNQHVETPAYRAQARRHTALLESLTTAARRAGLIESSETAGVRLWATVHGIATLINLGLVPPAVAAQVVDDTIGVPG